MIRTFWKCYNYIGFDFPDQTSFRGEVFETDVIFADATFGYKVSFAQAIFKGYANFTKSTFGKQTTFQGSRFQGKANLKYTTFEDRANFAQVTFDKKADFFQVQVGPDGNFREIHFQKEVIFQYATFERNADFHSARFEGRADFENTSFGENANFWKASFATGGSFRYSEITNAVLGHVDLTKIDLRNVNLSDSNMIGVGFERKTLKAMKNMPCRGIRVETSYGSPRFKRYAQDQDYLEEMRQTLDGNIVFWIWWFFANCGRSLGRWAIFSFLFAFVFGLIFWLMGTTHFVVKDLSDYDNNIFTYFYYSIVTFTTLGFGDITPKSLAAALVVTIEVIMGYVMLGGLISIFANKIARRS